MPHPERQRIWLTGAGSGIGLALAEELLIAGHHVALTGSAAEPLEALHRRFASQVMVVAGDINDVAQICAIGDRIAASWGALDMAIFNIGNVDSRRFETPLNERSDLITASYCIQEALPLLRLGQRPYLVGMLGAAALRCERRSEAASLREGELRQLFESLRVDIAPEGIDVTVINPGRVDMSLPVSSYFALPLRWSSTRAARYIGRRLQRQQRPPEIAFPAPLIVARGLLALLRLRVRLALGKHLTRN